MATRPSFTELPTEILETIFLHLDPRSFLALSQTCGAIHEISVHAPVVWRHFCQTYFKSWAPHHNIASKFAGPLSDVDWRALFILRKVIERTTVRLLDKLLESQQGRIRHFSDIADFGYDAKETLLKECACPDDAEDVLARRFYANAILERIQREMVIDVWKDMAHGKEVPLERALGAFDVFARTGADVDLDIITQDLDQLAHALLENHPDFNDQSTRAKSSTLASFLREREFKGVRREEDYRALGNSFIGLALRRPHHESLPLISVAIYCALASRLGLDARPCGFIHHVYCIIYAPKDYTVDNVYKPTNSSALQSMYLDPFHSSDEVPGSELVRLLREYGIPRSEYDNFLLHTTNTAMVLRTARNIATSVRTIRNTGAVLVNHSSAWLDTYPDMDSAFYATLWAMLVLGSNEEQDVSASSVSVVYSRRRQYLPYLLEHFQTHYPWDVTLLEHHVIPLFINQPEGERLLTFVHSMHNIDSVRKPKKPRNAGTQDVLFKVGQLFKHKRYDYEGVITGWDAQCLAGEEWIHHMGVNDLEHGQKQSFYHVLCSDKSVRYVAQENIQLVIDSSEAPKTATATGPSEAMLRLAGRHFKRWDKVARAFVSNVRDEFPND